LNFELAERSEALPARLAASAAAAVSTAAATSATTAPTEIAGGLRPRFIYHERSTVHLVLMEFVDCFLRVFVRCHLDKRKASRAARRLIAHDTYVIDCSCAAEELGEIFVRALIRKVANVQSAAHRCETLSRAVSVWRRHVGARAT
jgi:hypothetical protein